MIEMEKIINVAMAVNEEYLPYLAVTLSSFKSVKRKIHVYILFTKILDTSIQTLTDWVASTHNIDVSFVNVSSQMMDRQLFVNNSTNSAYLSEETYYRLLLPNLLPDIDRILYLDADVVVNDDILEIFDINMENFFCAAVPDIADNWKFSTDKDVESYRRDMLGITDRDSYFNAGVLLLDLNKLREKYSGSDLMEIASRYNWNKHDQDVLNFICKGNFYQLDYRWNLIYISDDELKRHYPKEIIDSYFEACKNPGIIHYAAKKPWLNIDVPNQSYFWNALWDSAFGNIIAKSFFAENRVISQIAIKKITNHELGIRFIAKCILSYIRRGR